MRKEVAIGWACAGLALGGCCHGGTGELTDNPRRCSSEVRILGARPAGRAYVQVGTVTTPSKQLDPLGNYQRTQSLGARLGGDAVVLEDWTDEPPEMYWRQPHTGTVISFTTSQLQEF